MRGLLVAILGLFLSATSAAFAAGGGELDALSRAIDSLGCYDVSFRLSLNGESMQDAGRYRVDGDRYSLEIAGLQVLGEGCVRYTIDDALSEVVIEPVGDDGSLSMVVQNPTQAFTSLGRYFDESKLSHTDSTTTLWLTPKSRRGQEVVLSIELVLDRKSHLPLRINYEADEETIGVEILSIKSTNEGVEIDYPEGYDIIDLR